MRLSLHFFTLYIIIHVLLPNYYYYYHQHSSLVEIGTIKINCLLFLDSVVLTWKCFFMYSQYSFGWSFEIIKTPLLNLILVALPQTMLQIEAGITYSSLSPDNGVLFQNRSLLKKVTDHTAHF